MAYYYVNIVCAHMTHVFFTSSSAKKSFFRKKTVLSVYLGKNNSTQVEDAGLQKHADAAETAGKNQRIGQKSFEINGT